MPKINKKFLLLISFIFFVLFIVGASLFTTKKPSTTPSPSGTPVPTATQTIEQQMKDQAIYDIEFSQESKATVNKYPFLTKLPIITSKYNIVFDFQLEKIRVRLKNVSQQSVQNEINLKLMEIGVDTSKYPVVYLSE